MKKILLTGIAFVLIAFSFAQTSNELKPVAKQLQQLYAKHAAFNEPAIFYVDNASAMRSKQAQRDIKNATVLKINAQALANITAGQPENLRFTIPSSQGNIILDLYKAEIFTDDFSVVTASNNLPFNYNSGVHYRGIVKGDNNSLVAISIFNDEVMGFVSMNNTNFVLGKIERDADGNHIFYDQRNLNASPSTGCYTIDDGEGYTAQQTAPLTGTETVKCVRLYWEVNYDIFTGKGGVTGATNYVTAVFNQSSTVYNNDGISTTLSQVFVWDVASPYTATSTSSLLTQFKAYRNSFNGDLANLLGYAGNGGIAAGFAGLCASNLDNSMCYSGIQSNYNNYPTYSWTVMVVTHEQGHLMGSRHTHACVWNGNNTAIDGCGPAAGYAYEGSCSGAPIPSGGGTIMSYCHLNAVGINMTLGFGLQPKTVIINNINNAACLTACSGGGCGVPSGLSAGNITTTTAIVSWTAVNGATSYNLQYKATSSGTWIPVNGLTSTSTTLSGLSIGTSYDSQVSAVCSTGSSGYSSTTSFVTLAGACTDNNEPNNTNATPKVITAGTLTGLISPAGDYDWFKFANSASTPNIKITLTNLPADYDLRLYRGSSLLVTSSHGGTTNEQAVYNTTTVASNYKIRINGYSNANNATLCYTLTTLLSASAFSPAAAPSGAPVNPVVDDATGIMIFPNPASDVVNVIIPASVSTTEIQLIDRLGKVVRELAQGNTPVDNKIQIDVNDLANGMYLMHVVQGGNVITQKLILNK